MAIMTEITHPNQCQWEVGEDTARMTVGSGESAASQTMRRGDLLGDWQIVFIGKCLNIGTVVFEQVGAASGAYCFAQENGMVQEVGKPDFAALVKPQDESKFYFGYSLEQVLDSGEDLLAKKVLEQGEPSLATIVDVLPRITKRQFGAVGGPASWGKITIEPNGNVVPQHIGNDGRPTPLFSPLELDQKLGSAKPVQGLLDGWMPVLLSRHEADGQVLELAHFVETGDPDRDPLVWSRATWQTPGQPGVVREELFIVSRSRPVRKMQIDPSLYWDALLNAVQYWKQFEGELSPFQLPEQALTDHIKGTLAALTTTFTGDHPHYGHGDYARELHDHFPPTFMTAIEVFHAYGMNLKARRIAEHVLAYVVDQAGRFLKRQGIRENYAASGSEYGQWLWLLERLEATMPPRGWILPYLDKVARTGDFLINSRAPIPEENGRRLVLLCAEADNNNRLYAYTGNNLWAVRGLEALGKLLKRYGRNDQAQYYADEAEDLRTALRETVKETKEESEFGPLVPFQFGYTAQPWTLSTCKRKPADVDEDTFKQYLHQGFILDHDIEGQQDLLENTYANYRYYLEMLSAMLLEPEEAGAIVDMRRQLGGELLGMTRFFSWIDDWPAANYARYLLAADQTDAYLLLLYSHLAHHGVPHQMIYYEQVTADGAVMAHDCVPNLILSSTMINWMFCFEPVGENAVYLGRGIPQRWYAEHASFGVEGLGSSVGPVALHINSRKDSLDIHVSLPEESGKTIFLDVRSGKPLQIEQIVKGADAIEKIVDGNRLLLKQGMTGKLDLSIALN